MEDRLRIEQEVLRRFGKESTPEERHGQVLVATQVVEQSLDLDFDDLLSDLAPMDLLIQRAGRLHRHVRTAEGARATSGTTARDGRPSPVLHVLTPERSSAPGPDWYERLFPRAHAVYPDTGKLWLTLEAIAHAKSVVSPGEPGTVGGVRALIEAVYGEDGHIPEELERASREAVGKARADASHANANAINLRSSYADDEQKGWYTKVETPTRLGEESQTVYLVREQGGRLVPLVPHERFPWRKRGVLAVLAVD